MKYEIDEAAGRLVRLDGATRTELPLYSDEAFAVLSDLWVKVGWDRKYSYTFSWLGRPVIQLPEDMIRYQEAVYRLRPDLIVETGIAHGGSLVYSASLCRLIGKGRVVGVDIEIRPHNRAAIEAHPLSAGVITMIEGSSVDPAVVARVRALAEGAGTVLVVLDSNHSYAHVMAELEAYAPLVTPGSYIVATDGIMRDVAGTPRAGAGWERDNPASAAEDFCRTQPDFAIEPPPWPFNESTLSRAVTHWPSAWIRRCPAGT